MAPFVKPAASATSSRLPSSTPRSANTRSPASSRSTRVSLFRLARMIPTGIKDTDQNPNRPAEPPRDEGQHGALGRVHRLRGMRTGVPGHGDLPGGRHAASVEELYRQKPGRVPGREPAREAGAQGILKTANPGAWLRGLLILAVGAAFFPGHLPHPGHEELHLPLEAIELAGGSEPIGAVHPRAHSDAVQPAGRVDEVVHERPQREVAAPLVIGLLKVSHELRCRQGTSLAQQLLGAPPQELLLVPDLGAPRLGEPQATTPPRLVLEP